MDERASPLLLAEFSRFLAAQIGLHFPTERWPELRRGLQGAAREFGFVDEDTCMRGLMSAPLSRTQVEVLASHLTVGETYFYREPKVLEAFRHRVLPELIERRAESRLLRIWSAGCCTGEEPYTIAAILREALPDFDRWNITLLATDINIRFLEKAAKGIYNDWSFRNLPAAVRERHFTRQAGDRYAIAPRIKRCVSFGYLNLAEDAYPALTNNTNAMDVIFCRNVLMYFAEDRARAVAGKLYRALIDGGWLIVSPSETSHALFGAFAPVAVEGVTLYRKSGKSGKSAVEGALPWEAPARAVDRLVAAPPEVPMPCADSGALTPVEMPRPEEMPPIEGGAAPTEPAPAARPGLYEQALACFERGRYTEALEIDARLLAADGADARATVLAARIHANQGRLAEAQHWCERAIALDKMNPMHRYLLAAILNERGAADAAVAALHGVLYLDQDFVLAHFLLGAIGARRGRDDLSRKHFENAMALLDRHRLEEVLPGAEGLTVGGLKALIAACRNGRE